MQDNNNLAIRLLIVVSSLLLSLLSPFIGYIYIISLGGGYLYRSEPQKAIGFCLLMITGALTLLFFSVITILEVGDIVIGIVLVMAIFIYLLRSEKDYVKAFFYAGIVQIVYGVFRKLAFGDIYGEKVESLSAGTNTILEENISGLGDAARQSSLLFENLFRIMIEYQIAIWSITMLMAMYLAMVFLARNLDIEWKHHHIKFPYWFSYVLIATLVLAVYPGTRLIGMNGLLMIMAFFLIQGLSIIDFIARNHFKKSRFIMIATVFLLIINAFFALLVAAIGLLDNWLDIRKINDSQNNV